MAVILLQLKCEFSFDALRIFVRLFFFYHLIANTPTLTRYTLHKQMFISIIISKRRIILNDLFLFAARLKIAQSEYNVGNDSIDFHLAPIVYMPCNVNVHTNP